MRDDGSAIHGTAFLIGDIGLIAMGRSGAGKSMLVAGLATSSLGPSIRLVADDRVKLRPTGNRLVARPIAGFLGRIELRGFGMAELPAMPSAVMHGVVRLTPEEPQRIPDQVSEIEAVSGIPLPVLAIREGVDCAQRFLTKWPHFRGLIESR
jgi:serine kinase of HPr protein (carbohydrate metabolism regulator)